MAAGLGTGLATPRPPPVAGMAADIVRDEAKIGAREAGLAEVQAKTGAEREATLAPMEAQLAAELGKPAPERPASQLPEYKPQPVVDAKEYEQFSYGLIAMAMIGGIASKGKWLEVGNSLNGAMTGYLKGNHEVAAKLYKDYETGFKTALAKEQQANKEFDDVLSNRKLKINDMISQYKVIAAKYDRQEARQAAETRSIDSMRKSVSEKKVAVARIEEQSYQTAERLGQQLFIHQQNQSAQAAARAEGRADRQDRADKAPAGYSWGPPDAAGNPTLVPIAGGPAGAKAGAADSKAVQKLGHDFEKAKLSETIGVMEEAKKVTPELAAFVSGPKSVLPDMAVSAEAREARQAVQKLFNITLKDRSGAAVTEQELERLKKEFGTGVFKVPSQLIDAIKKAETIIQKHYSGVAAGHGKAALDAYNANLEAIGGVPFKPAEAPGGRRATDKPGGGPKKIGGDQEYEALPSGTEFIGPDGQTRRKP